MSPNFRRRMDAQSKKLQEVFSKELENAKSNQIELNNIITEMKNTLEGINSGINEAAEWISELEEWWKSLPWNRIKKKGTHSYKGSLRDLWNNIKFPPIHIIHISEEERRGLGK